MAEEIIVENCGALTAESKAKSEKELHNHLEVAFSSERSFVIVVAVHKDSARNFVNRISCKQGIPIGGFTYDAQNDNYHIECADYLYLGYVPASFMTKVKHSSWSVRVPMSESVLKKYLSALQKKELRNFKNHFKAEEYNLQYLQMIDPN